MRFITLLIFLASTLFGENEYELQLLATKSSDQKPLNKVLKRGETANLSCYQSEEVHDDGVYYYIRCDKTDDYKLIKRSLKKAKKAGLKAYILQREVSENISTVQIDIQTENHHESKIVTYDKTDEFFGNNQELMELLYNKNEVSKDELEKRKKRYLQSVIKREEFNGLYLKGSSSRNFTKERTGYDIRLQWNLFEGGYLGSQSDLKDILLQKELEYDRIFDNYRSANLELSIYKMQAISNFINYHFLKQQEIILSQIYQKAQQQYDSSMITASTLYNYKKSMQKVKHMLFFYENTENEPYDIKLKPFIENIENGSMVEKERLTKHVYANSMELKTIYNKMAQISKKESWLDKLRTNLFVENKKYDYLNESDTVAGVQMQLPLDFKTQKDQSKDIELDANKMQIKYVKNLIAKSIDDIYRKIKYHKSYIKSLESDIDFFQHEAKTLQMKSKYPLPKQTQDTNLELSKLNLDISKLHQDIWLERTETLKLLLKLQSISGVQILSF